MSKKPPTPAKWVRKPSAKPTAKKPPTDDGTRRPDGRFGTGNAGGPGGPRPGSGRPRTEIRQLHTELMNDEQDIRATYKALMRLVRQGNAEAIRYRLNRPFGSPKQSADVNVTEVRPLSVNLTPEEDDAD